MNFNKYPIFTVEEGFRYVTITEEHISMHLKEAIEEGELSSSSPFLIVATSEDGYLLESHKNKREALKALGKAAIGLKSFKGYLYKYEDGTLTVTK